MGMYTEIRIDLTLKEDAPQSVHATLKAMSMGDRVNFKQNHPLFSTERWGVMLVCGSAYFDEKPHHEWNGRHFICVSNFKNYDNEAAKFADWIRPFCEPQEKPFMTAQYEEDVWKKTYYTDGRTGREP